MHPRPSCLRFYCMSTSKTSTRKAIHSGREASLHFSTKADQKMKLSAAGGNRLLSDVSSDGARWLAELKLLWSNAGNGCWERGEGIGRGDVGRAGHRIGIFGLAPPPPTHCSATDLRSDRLKSYSTVDPLAGLLSRKHHNLTSDKQLRMIYSEASSGEREGLGLNLQSVSLFPAFPA